MANTSLKQRQLVTTYEKGTVDIRQLPTIVLRHRFLVLGVSSVVISVASLLALMVKPTYESYMQILVSSNLSENRKSNNIQASADSEVNDSNLQVDDSSVQQKIMLSSNLIQKAVNLLHSNYPDITLEDIKGGKEKNKKAPLVVKKVEGETVVNNMQSQVLEVSFEDENPVKAQRVLQSLQKVYLDYNIEQQKQRLKKGLDFVNTRLPEVKKQASESEKNLEQFRKKHNLLDPEVQSKILLNSLADIQKQLQTTRAQLQDAEARHNNLEQIMAASAQNSSVSSRLNQSSRYQSLLNEIQKTELALAQERLRYTDDYPTVEKLKQQRQSQLALLRQEAERSLKDKTPSSKEQSLLTQGQMLGIDPTLVNELVLVQTTTLGLKANEKSLVDSEQQLRSELTKYPNLIAEYNRLRLKVESSRKTLEQLLQSQQSLGLKIAQGGYDWQVLQAPEIGTYKGGDKLLLLLGSVIIGPILGVAAALLWEMFNHAIYSVQDLQKLTNLRVLGSVPKLPQRGVKKKLSSLSLNGRPSLPPSRVETSSELPIHETLDMIYQNIQILKYPFPFNSVMLTSALPGEGKTTLALGLGASAAHMNRRVLVIDANLRDPSLHKNLELSNDWGLSLLLLDETITQVQNYIQPIHPSIDVLTAGPIAEDTVKLLSSRRMKELLELFEQTYDLVLIDAPPILGTVDARIMASFCNGVVIVGRMGQVTPAELTQVIETLSQLNLIGIIANEEKNSLKF